MEKPLNTPYGWLEKSLQTIHNAHWYRQEKTISGLPGSSIALDGKKMLNFASNNYLGLAGDSRLLEAAIEAIRKYGTGATGSRLLSGHRQLHRDLESAIAALKDSEDALVFSSGYLANVGTIAALVGKKDLIVADEYNHSSLKNGAKLSQAQVVAYSHGDWRQAALKLQQYRQKYRRCLIVTDSIFSMDGDLCPLPELIELAREFNCMVLIDEAHATGVIGENGAGCLEHFGLGGEEIIQVGTLSKAVGSSGGYVAGSKNSIDFLRNRCPTWIYTTGLSPADAGAALKGIEIIATEPEIRQELGNNVRFLRESLADLKIKSLPSQSPIISIPLETAREALNLAQKLEDNGIFAPAIRPPTVPTSRLRLSVMATHQLEHLQHLVSQLAKNLGSTIT